MSKDLGKQTTENIKEKFKDVSEIGEKIVSEGEKVSSIIGSIDTSFLDSDDSAAIENVKSQDSRLWDTALKEEVDTPQSEIKNEAGSHISDMEKSKNATDAAAEKLREAGSASDIGSDVASEGTSHMKDSSGVYESLSNETKSAVSQSEQTVANLKSRKGNLF